MDFIEEYNKIRGFFNSYRTEVSEGRLKELSDYVRTREGGPDEIAVCVFGSLSFGMSEEASDIDVVLFSKGLEKLGEFPMADKIQVVESCPLGTAYMHINSSKAGLRAYEKMKSYGDYFALASDSAGRDFMRLVDIYSTILCSDVVGKKVTDEILAELHKDAELSYAIDEAARGNCTNFWPIDAINNSLKKYRSRLKQRNIEMPYGINESIRNFMLNLGHRLSGSW